MLITYPTAKVELSFVLDKAVTSALAPFNTIACIEKETH